MLTNRRIDKLNLACTYTLSTHSHLSMPSQRASSSWIERKIIFWLKLMISCLIFFPWFLPTVDDSDCSISGWPSTVDLRQRCFLSVSVLVKQTFSGSFFFCEFGRPFLTIDYRCKFNRQLIKCFYLLLNSLPGGIWSHILIIRLGPVSPVFSFWKNDNEQYWRY